MLNDRRLAVVLPAFSAGERLAAAVATLPAEVDDIIVVDDASADGSATRAVLGDDPRLIIVRHAWNRGVGAAITSGYRAARARGAEVLVVMAGDGQMDPADLPAIALPITRGEVDYAKGNRLGHPRIADMPTLRRFGTTALGAFTAWAIDEPGLSDSQCGYTAIAGWLIDDLPLETLWPRYGYPNDLLGMIKRAGGRIEEITVRPIYAGERSGLRVWHVLTIAGLIARTAARVRLDRWLGQPRSRPSSVAPRGASSADALPSPASREPLAQARSRDKRSPIARSSP